MNLTQYVSLVLSKPLVFLCPAHYHADKGCSYIKCIQYGLIFISAIEGVVFLKPCFYTMTMFLINFSMYICKLASLILLYCTILRGPRACVTN